MPAAANGPTTSPRSERSRSCGRSTVAIRRAPNCPRTWRAASRARSAITSATARRPCASPRRAPAPPAGRPIEDEIAVDGRKRSTTLLLDRAAVASAARGLDDRERWIVLLLFFCDCTQSDVAVRLGLSQAHVSRLLGGAIEKMRRQLAGPSFVTTGTSRYSQGQ